MKGENAGALDWIKIATHDWFHLGVTNEVYHYDGGKFEAYPLGGGGRFLPQYLLKVLLDDAVLVLVEKDNNGYLRIAHKLDWYYSLDQNKLYHRK